MKLTKKHIIFSIAFMLLIISVIYRILNPFVQPRTDKLTFTGMKKKIKQDSAPHAIKQSRQSESQILAADFLNKPEISGKAYKDLFSTYKSPLKIAEKKIAQSLEKDIEPEKSDVIKNAAMLEAMEDISSYRLSGTYKTKDTKAVFLTKNKLVIIAKPGDRLDGKYLIEDIQDNYIRITVLDSNETIHLDMRGFNNE